MSVNNAAGVPPRRARLPVVLPTLAVAAVLLALVWIKGGAIAVRLGWKQPEGTHQSGTASAGPASDGHASEDLQPRLERTASPFPTEVKLASPRIAREMGIELASVDSRPLAATIACNGRVSFNQNHYAQIRSRAPGIVRRIAADVGAAVDAGDVLAVVDSPLLGDVKSAYLNALTREGQFAWEYERLKKLTDQQAIPIKSFRDAQSAYEQQQTTTANDRQQLVNLGFSPEQLERLIAAKDTSTELPVVAPWAAVVVSRNAVEGEFVERNEPLFAIADLRTMWVYLNLYEADLGRVRLGQTVEFTADGLPDAPSAGRIDWISPEVDARSRITQARAEVANTAGALRANMFGKARIAIHESHDGLVVPELAVQTYRERPVIFVRQADDRFAVRPVTIGVKQERYWELLSGAMRGEEVATTGSFLLKSELEKEQIRGDD